MNKVISINPSPFIKFITVGGIGTVIHFAVLYVLVEKLEMLFVIAQAIATYTAMTCNFFLNNSLTFKNYKLVGIERWIGLLNFMLMCSIGAILNLIMAQWVYGLTLNWFLAGFSGALSGVITNYKLSSSQTWKVK